MVTARYHSCVKFAAPRELDVLGVFDGAHVNFVCSCCVQCAAVADTVVASHSQSEAMTF